MSTGNAAFDLFRISEDHEALREAVRAVAQDKIAPHAADVDENERYTVEAQKALTAAGFQAVHIPEAYDGAGADAVATVIVIEEVARVCASSSLIPAVNKLGSLPVILSGSEELKHRYLNPMAKGDAMFSYCLSEPDAGSDAAGMKTKAVRDGDHYVLNGVKRWITNAGVSEFYTVMAVTDPEKRSKGISAFVVEKSDEGVSFGAPEKKLGIKGSPTREVYLDNVRIPADHLLGERGAGFAVAQTRLGGGRIHHAMRTVGLVGASLDMMLELITARDGRALANDVSEQFIHPRIRGARDQQRMAIQSRLGVANEKLAAAIGIMETPTDEASDVWEIAARVSLSPRQLERLFIAFNFVYGSDWSKEFLIKRIRATRNPRDNSGGEVRRIVCESPTCMQLRAFL